MDKIKLVIWDLDETFWNGTLSEEKIIPIEKNIEIVKTLTERGIINSVVSKNDFDQAKEKLKSLGIWDYFVFPAIQWSPKGQLIKEIIEKCQLRPVNVIFLDDNELNLKEASFYNPDLNTYLPQFINSILSHSAFQGKDDKKLSRLKQYKILEKKDNARQNHSSNLDFLKSSHIKISILTDLLPHLDRIEELIERSNQLNFTKVRIGKDEIASLIKNEQLKMGLVHVKDDFGDYGFVGFYALDSASNNLNHFVFSCRILNLGIAQYIYAKLGFPQINIIPEVAENLDRSHPDWIEEVTYIEPTKGTIESSKNGVKKNKLLFRGGCDFKQVLFYLKNNHLEIDEEVNYVNKENFPIHQSHSQVLLGSLSMTSEDKRYLVESDFIPFIDEDFFTTSFFDPGYEALIYNLSMDFTQELYRHKKRNIIIPVGGYHSFWTDPKAENVLIRNFQSKGIKSVTKESLSKFRGEFDHIGQIKPEKLIQNLVKIREMVPAEKPIIFINGPELNAEKSLEKNTKERHEIMNAALDQFIGRQPNTYLLDLRKLVTFQEQLTINTRHFNRETYRNIALELLQILDQVLDHSVNTKLSVKSKILSKSLMTVSLLKNFVRKAFLT